MMLGVPQGSVVGSQLYLLYTAEIFYILEIKHYCNVDNSTLVAIVPSLFKRVAVAGFLNNDLTRVSKWCNLRFGE